MFKKLLLIFFAFPVVARAQSLPTILPIGDSITLGQYPCIVKEELNGNVNFMGIYTNSCGLGTIAITARGADYMWDVYRGTDVQTLLSNQKPDYAFILLGTNDARGNSPELVQNRIQQIVDDLSAKGISNILVSKLPPLAGSNNVDDINRAIAKITSAKIVEQSGFTISHLSSDGIHPTPDGAKIIACNFLKTSGLKATCGPITTPTPLPKPGREPKSSEILKKPCDVTYDTQFHPLRPFPGSPCDPLIPKSIPEAPKTEDKKYNTFACGNALTPVKQEWFNPYGRNKGYEEELLQLSPGEIYAKTVCSPSEDEIRANPRKYSEPFKVTCWRSEAFDVKIDLSKANIGILGNTQNPNLTDAQKVNEYLSWYLTGTPQIGDQIPIDVDDRKQLDRLLTFAGPIRKLLPFDLGAQSKANLAKTVGRDIHNYLVGCNQIININPLDYIESIIGFLKNAGLATLEIGEVISKFGGITIEEAVKIAISASEVIQQPNTFEQARQKYLAKVSSVSTEKKLDIFIYLFYKGTRLATLVDQAFKSLKPLSPLQAVACINPDLATQKVHINSYDEFWAEFWQKSEQFGGGVGFLASKINEKLLQNLFQNIPFSTLEDTAGEYTLSVFRDPTAGQQYNMVDDPKSSKILPGRDTAPVKLIITKAELGR
jgi:hypothetical protein